MNNTINKSSLIFQSLNPIIKLNCSDINITYGIPITFTITVSIHNNSYTPTGNINLSTKDNSIHLGTTELNNGTAIFIINSLLVGSYDIVANYSGDEYTVPGTSTPLNINIIPTSSNILLQLSPNNNIIYKTPIKITAVFISNGIPDKNIEFLNNTKLIGTAPIVQGMATLTIILNAGQHSLQAVYPGDNNILSSTSNIINLDIIPAKSYLTLIADRTTIKKDQEINLTANVISDNPNDNINVGTVIFFEETHLQFLEIISVVNGTAHYKHKLHKGSYIFRSVYTDQQGEISQLPALSNSLQIVVE